MNIWNIGKKLARLSLAATLVLGCTRIQAQEDLRDFWLLNDTGKQITQFYVSPHERIIWGRDVLGLTTLPNGEGTKITFRPAWPSSCVMDFRIVFDDDTEQVYSQGRNVCQLDAVKFNPRDSVGLR